MKMMQSCEQMKIYMGNLLCELLPKVLIAVETIKDLRFWAAMYF